MLKKFLFVSLIVSIVAGGQLTDAVKAGKIPTKFEYSACDTPIYYSVGEVDEKFGVKKENFLSSVNRAAQIWNKEAGRDIFRYTMNENLASKGETLQIHFKYDKRQALTTQIGQITGKVYKDESSLRAAITDYEGKVADFNSRMEAFNAEVQKWNEKGGVSPEEYERLRGQERQLQEEATSLANLAKELSLSSEKYSSQVGKLNSTIEAFNSELARRPEEGLFNPNNNTIEIYFFANQTELLHTLAHELGHARGLEHINNESEIMFPYTTDVLMPGEEDRLQLNEICRERDIIDETLQTGRAFIEKYKLLLIQNF
ncbi:MAG: Uncharacterized protein G01um10145_486 [Microgenomates group bacterium Gr01-1014_5]|nr:MAG: Uncharacterized protein G01um10145_486 [Microgenomates group bacterium Gr01-1014_5]